MPIPESQLSTWAHQGAIAGSQATYATVKTFLESASAPYIGRNYSVFLQGSYGNDTNIYAESDVDIVIQLNDCFQSDRARLSPQEEASWRSVHSDASYGYETFKAEVLGVLRKAFPNAVSVGDKAFGIQAQGNRRKADVLACIGFRHYHSFKSMSDQSFHDGVCFCDKFGKRIANYPRQHSINMAARHQSSDKRLKPMVRVLKNLRSQLVDEGRIESGTAPSYFIEGLLFNVPDWCFMPTFQETFVSAFTWIQEANQTDFTTANKQFYLIRDGHKTCWRKADADAFLRAAVELWNEW